MKPYKLLENILLDIEEGIKNNITVNILSKKYNYSEIHLRRLFSFAFNRPISGYTRSRALSESLNDLLNTDKNIFDIALKYGFTHKINHEEKYSEYLPSVQARNLFDIPHGLNGATFNTSMCVRFRYIGQHHYYDINRDIANKMYSAICKYINDENARYSLLREKIYFERVDTRQYDGNYCQMEWFTPLTEKTA